MGRILLYSSLVLLLLIGSWFYYRQEEAPEELLPFIVLLLGLMSLGYGMKAQQDGDIGAGSGRIRREGNPGLFQLVLYFNYLLTGLLILLGAYLLFT